MGDGQRRANQQTEHQNEASANPAEFTRLKLRDIRRTNPSLMNRIVHGKSQENDSYLFGDIEAPHPTLTS